MKQIYLDYWAYVTQKIFADQFVILFVILSWLQDVEVTRWRGKETKDK